MRSMVEGARSRALRRAMGPLRHSLRERHLPVPGRIKERPPPPDISTNRGIDIVPECRSKGTFVARFNRNPVNRFGAVR